MCHLIENFSPELEDFTRAHVWIRLYSLQNKYWVSEVFEGVGNTLGRYITTSEITKIGRYTSYARICVYMNVSKALPEATNIWHKDFDWYKILDYEDIPLRCKKFHEHGHLYQNYPLNAKAKEAPKKPYLDPEGFKKVNKKEKHGKIKKGWKAPRILRPTHQQTTSKHF